MGSFWKSSFGRKLGEGLGGGLGQGLAGQGLDKLFPGDAPLTGTQQGQKQKEYFESLYGGKLNPWELAGAGGQGVGGTAAPLTSQLAARETMKKQKNREGALQSVQQATQIQVAEINKEGQIGAANIYAGKDPGMKQDQMIASTKKDIGQLDKYRNEVKLVKSKTDLMRVAVEVSNELLAVIKTLKGKNKTVLESAQKGLQLIIKSGQITKKDVLNALTGKGQPKRPMEVPPNWKRKKKTSAPITKNNFPVLYK